MLLPISGSGFRTDALRYYDWFVRARFWLAVSAIQSASILKPLISFFYNLSYLWFFNYFMLWFFYNSLFILFTYQLRNNYVIFQNTMEQWLSAFGSDMETISMVSCASPSPSTKSGTKAKRRSLFSKIKK